MRKIAIIDVDDTILATREVYGPVREKIFKIFDDLRLTPYAYAEPFTNSNSCIGLYNMFKQLNKPAKAVGNTDLTVFPNVFVTMYQTLLHRRKGTVGPIQQLTDPAEVNISRTIYDIAYSVYETAPPVVDGAVEFLLRLSRRGWEIVYYTMGDKAVQGNRLFEQTDLHKYADEIHIVKQKTVEEFKRFVEYDLDVMWESVEVRIISIGDSPLDSVPALAYNVPVFIRHTEYHPESDFPNADRIVFFDSFNELWNLDYFQYLLQDKVRNPVEEIKGMSSLC